MRNDETVCCGSCRFYHKESEQCRRRSPAVAYGKSGPIAAWPVTEGSDWCGEFERDPSEETPSLRRRQ